MTETQATLSEHAWKGEVGLEEAIRTFKQTLPGWWYSLGECERTCDASCAPTRESADLALIERDKRFDDGFHVDIYQPSTLAEALLDVMQQALEAKAALGAPSPAVFASETRRDRTAREDDHAR